MDESRHCGAWVLGFQKQVSCKFPGKTLFLDIGLSSGKGEDGLLSLPLPSVCSVSLLWRDWKKGHSPFQIWQGISLAGTAYLSGRGQVLPFPWTLESEPSQ